MAGFVNKIRGIGFWPSTDENDEMDDYDNGIYENDTYDSSYDDVYDSVSSRSRDASSYSSQKRPQASRVVNINATAKLQVVLFKPVNFGDETRAIANELTKSHTVVLNLEEANAEVSRRTIDFLSGVAFANRGQIKRVATKTFIILPHNVDLTGDDLLDELESNGVYF